MMPSLASFVAAGAAGVLIACTGHSTPPPPIGNLQMNDLSVLLPLPNSQADLDAMLAPTAAGYGGQLFPQAVHDSAGDSVAYELLHAVAFRLDPCFGQLGAITDPSACNAQLRVVFQPIDYEAGTGAIVDDAAIHAFYTLTQEQFDDAVHAMVATRDAANGSADLGPLAPHPLVVKQGLQGTVAQAFEQIITQYAGSANLIRFTSFTVEELVAGPALEPDGGDFWNFQSFNVGSGSATPRQIATLPAQTTEMELFVESNPLATSFSPETTSQDDIAVLATYADATMATSAVLGSAFDAALRIENPHDNSPDTIDCGSCHMAPNAIQLVGTQLGMSATGNVDAFVPDASIPTADLAQTTQFIGSDGILNIHAFSYRSTSPMINQRVINETAANVAYVASQLE
jgi:hypothetical protein